MRLHESHFSGRGFDLTNFRKEALKFFDRSDGDYRAYAGFFNNFTIIWRAFLNQGHLKNAEQLWDLSLNIAYEWENKNQNKGIHKGTPYYFWGGTCMSGGRLASFCAAEEIGMNTSGENEKPLRNLLNAFWGTRDYLKEKVGINI